MFMNIPTISNSRWFHAGGTDGGNSNCLGFEVIDNKGKTIDFNWNEFAAIKIAGKRTGRFFPLLSVKSSSIWVKSEFFNKDRY